MSVHSIIQAVKRNDTATVQRLLHTGSDMVNLQGGSDNATPLYYAAKEGFMEMVELLTDVKLCNLNIGSSQHISPFLSACAAGQTFVAQQLQDKGCNVEHVDDLGRSAVHHAAMSSQTHTLKYLIGEVGLNKNERDANGHTPLHLAALHNQNRSVSFLIKSRCDLNTFNSSGATPLWSVCSLGLTELAKVFIHEIVMHGSKYWLDEIDTEGRCAVYEAVRGKHLHLLQDLVKAGADVNICRSREGKKPFTGESPLLRAIQHGDLEYINVLLRAKGCDVDLPFRGQKVTPLHWAVILDNEMSTRWREDPMMNEQLGECPITYIQIIQCILQYKPVLDSLDDQYHTPLHTASSHGNRTAVKLLCEHGADINMKCKRSLSMEDGGKLYVSPIEMALWKGQTEVVKDLVILGAEFVIGEWMTVSELRTRLNDNPFLLQWIKENRK